MLPGRLAIGWLSVLALALIALSAIQSTSTPNEGEATNVGGVTHQAEVMHGPEHVFYGANMDAQNPDNVICEPGSDDESIRCPDACTDPVPAGTPRVRRAIHTLTAEQWTRVVNAMWVMRTVSTKDGVDIYGPFYRDYDYFLLFHSIHGGISGAGSDVTGGSSHFGTWHAAHVLDFETSLLAVDPEIEALPYLDWEQMPVRSDLFNTFFGTPGGSLTDFYAQYKQCPKWDVPCASWTTFAGMYQTESLLDADNHGIVNNGPFAYWPITTGAGTNGWVDKERKLGVLSVENNLGMMKQKGEQDWVAYWGDADGFLSHLTTYQPPGVFGGLPVPPFSLMKDYAVDLNGTQLRDVFLAAPVPYLVRNLVSPDDDDTDYALVESAEFVGSIYKKCVADLGNYIGEHVNCLQGRVNEQTFDLHDAWHASVGGDNKGIGGPNDPAFWFHHSAVIKAQSHWGYKNRQLRSRAWGYFIKGTFSNGTIEPHSSNSAPVDLNDVIGSPPNGDSTGTPKLWEHTNTQPLFGAGFDRERLMGRSDAGMEATIATPMKNVDVLCGDVEALYTYDVIVEEKAKDLREASERRTTRTVAVVALLVALAGAALLAGPTQRVLFGPPEVMKPMRASSDEYDMKINEAARAARPIGIGEA